MTTERMDRSATQAAPAPKPEVAPVQEAPKLSRFRDFMAGASDADKLELGAYAKQLSEPDIQKIKQGHDVALSLAKSKGWEKVAQEEKDAIRDEKIAFLVQDKGYPADLFEGDEDGNPINLERVNQRKADYDRVLRAVNARNGKPGAAPTEAKPEDDLLTRIAQLEATIAKGSGTATANLPPTGGGGAAGSRTMASLADGEWDPKEADRMLRNIGLRS